MSKPQFAILRFAKYKGPEISNIEAHNERTKEKYASNPDVDTSRSHLNFHLIMPERKYRAEAERQIKETGCRTRSDSVRVVEALVTATPEFFKGKKKDEIKAYFQEALDFIREHQDPKTIISAVVHMDEKTPHTLDCGAIVNAANSGMTGCYQPCHNCIDNCIHTYAGVQLRLKCAEIMERQGFEEPTGQAKITPAYNLPCDYVIHTVGPIVQGKLTRQHCKLLESCYRSCLTLADENQVPSIAFCCISTGVFMFPNDEAAEIAVRTVQEYKAETGSKIEVIFNVFKEQDERIYSKLLRAD